jgi:hypothetical protein
VIQLKRGSTVNWRRESTLLAAGQPGYDKEKHKIKIGDGESSWSTLPYASGLTAEEILNSEEKAKERYSKDSEDITIITYGTESPDENTIGQLYLQHYESDPEVDYIVSSGISGIWSYQKWNSGIAKCFVTFEHTTSIQEAIGSNLLYKNSTAVHKLDYPITFTNIPSETATVQSPGGLVWLATSGGLNTKKQTAIYMILSPDKQNNATYRISLQVEGRWK